jgi:hypothetical protein
METAQILTKLLGECSTSGNHRRLTASIHDHQQPSIRFSYDRFESLPARPTTLHLRFLIANESRMCDCSLSWTQKPRSKRKRREEEKDCKA